MSAPIRTVPPGSDLLGETLHQLRLTGTLYCRAELTAPWGVAVPELPELMTLLVVTTGRCWLEVDGAEPRLLEAGSLGLIPHGTPHRMRSAPGVPVEPLFELPYEQVTERYERMRIDGGGELTQITYAAMRADQAAARRLVAQLPTVLHIDSWDDDTAGWLHSTLRLIGRESRAVRPGGETVLTRLADILVIQAIRSWLDSAPEARQGWLAALRDDQLGRALRAIHREPGADWNLTALAREAGLSRSVFAARFTASVGEPAGRYLAQWRLQSARIHLRETAEPLSAVAHRFGYRSEAAFSRAFKREFGTAPGGVRGAVVSG